MYFFFFSSRRRHTRCSRDWSSDVCSSDLVVQRPGVFVAQAHFDGRRAGKLEAVLEEAIGRPRAKLHLRNAGLALLHGGGSGERRVGEECRSRGAPDHLKKKKKKKGRVDAQ